jgi:hypothetical protein
MDQVPLLDVLFLFNVCSGSKFAFPYSVLLAFTFLLVTRDFTLFAVGSSCKICPSVRRMSTANTMCKAVDILNKQVGYT